MNLVENFQTRINSIDNRSVLLSLINDFDKLLNEKQKISTGEIIAILRSFLDRLTPSIFGLLTEREFEEIFALTVLKCDAMETIVLLIQYLSSISTDDYFKLFKLVQLINFTLKNNFEKIFLCSTNDNTNINYKQFKEHFSQTLCSFSDRIYNFYDQKNVRNGAKIVFEFEENLLDNLKTALKGNKLKSGCFNLQFCLKILIDYGIVSYRFINAFVEWILLDENSELNEIWQILLINSDIDFRKREQMLIILVLIAQDGVSLKRLFNDSVIKNQFLMRILTQKLLIERVLPPTNEIKKRISQKISDYFLLLSAHELICETLMKLMRIFSDQAIILETVNFDQQFKLAIAILDFANKIRPEDYLKLKEEVINRLVTSVPEYLKFADNSRRQIGMFIAETLTNRFGTFSLADKIEPLKFDYVETDPVYMELKAIANFNEQEKNFTSASEKAKKLTPETNLNSVNNKQKKKFNSLKLLMDSRTQILDSDDDEYPEEEYSEVTDKDFEKEMQELELNAKTGRPYYLRDCLTNLNEKENYKIFAMAIRYLPKLIEAKAIGLDDLSIELMEKLIYLEDKFNIPNFSKLRKESLKLIFAHRSELIAPALRILFSIHCNMSSRYFILSCLEASANYLVNVEQQNLPPKVEIVKKEEKTKKFGKIIREYASSNTKIVAKASENQFSKVAHLFIYPLMDIKQNYGQHLDLFDRDHILLGKILWTVGQLIILAKNCHILNRILSSLFPLLNFLRSNSHSFVTNAILFCYSAIGDSMDKNLLKSLFVNELEDCLEWLAELLLTTTKIEADPMLRESLRIAAFKISQILRPPEIL